MEAPFKSSPAFILDGSRAGGIFRKVAQLLFTLFQVACRAGPASSSSSAASFPDQGIVTRSKVDTSKLVRRLPPGFGSHWELWPALEWKQAAGATEPSRAKWADPPDPRAHTIYPTDRSFHYGCTCVGTISNRSMHRRKLDRKSISCTLAELYIFFNDFLSSQNTYILSEHKQFYEVSSEPYKKWCQLDKKSRKQY